MCTISKASDAGEDSQQSGGGRKYIVTELLQGAPATLLDACHTLDLILSMIQRPSYKTNTQIRELVKVAHRGSKSVKASCWHSQMKLPSSSAAARDRQASNQPECLAAYSQAVCCAPVAQRTGCKEGTRDSGLSRTHGNKVFPVPFQVASTTEHSSSKTHLLMPR